MKETLKQLNELAERYYPSQDASLVSQELHKVEELAYDTSAPLPDEGLLDSIKFDISQELVRQRFVAKRRLLSVLAVAACVIIAAVFAIKLQMNAELPLSNDTPAAPLTAGNELAAMRWNDQTNKIDDLDTAIGSIELALYENVSSESELDWNLTAIENQVSELNELFWKG